MKRRLNKRGLTPLIATLFLIIGAMVLGSVVMSFGKGYMEDPDVVDVQKDQPPVCETKVDLGPLKNLQILHINGVITTEEYLAREKTVR